MRSWRIGVVVLCLVGAPSCGGDDGSDTTAGGSTTSSTATTTSAPPASIELGANVDLGEGVVVGAHPSSPIAYVSAIDHETTEVGCEGGDVAILWAQPVDGGARIRAISGSPLTGTVLLGGAGGRVALVDQCEGFLTTLAVARPAADGTLGDVVEIDTTEAQQDAQLMPSSIRWSADGTTFVGLVQRFAEGSDVVHVVRLALDGEVEDLGERPGVIAVAELGDGRLVTATATAVTVDNGEPTSVAVTSISISPDGTSIAVFGEDGVSVLEPGVPLASLATDASSVGSWSADGDALAHLRLVGDDAAVWVTHVDGASAEVAAKGGFGAPLFTADDGAVLFNDAVDSGRGFTEPRATARHLNIE